MTASTRADRLFSALSAKERALMVLRAWKAGREEEDRQVRSTIPDAQVAEFNELIARMNAVNERLGPYILLLRANVEQLGLLEGWIATLMLWGLRTFELGMHIFAHEPYPITQSDYDRLKKTTRRREPRPDWGLRYEVLPDEKAGEVQRRRAERAHIREVISAAPWSPDAEAFGGQGADDEASEKIHRILVRRLRERFLQYWEEMRSVEIFLAEAAKYFDGEDPALPEVRAILDWMRPELVEIHGNLKGRHLQALELPEPDEPRLESVRRIAHWPEQRSDLTDDDLVRHITISLSERDS